MKHSVRRSCQLLAVGAVALLPVLGSVSAAVLNVVFFSVDASAAGYPAASPVLTTTSIS